MRGTGRFINGPIKESIGDKEMSQITEIASDVFKIATFIEEANLFVEACHACRGRMSEKKTATV